MKVFHHLTARARTTTLGALLLALLALIVATATSQAAVRPATIIASDPTNSLQPQVDADSASNLHVVWYDGGTNRGVKYVKGAWTGSGYNWGGIQNVYFPGAPSTFVHPRIAIDSQDTVHVVWSFNNGTSDVIYYRSWPASAGPDQGTAPLPLGTGFYPSIDTDAANHVHVMWESNSTNGVNNFDIFYREGVGGAFTPVVNLSSNSGDSLNPDVAVELDWRGAQRVVRQNARCGQDSIHAAQWHELDDADHHLGV